MTGRRIVVGYDGSESSQVALTWALGDARNRKLPVLIASVFEAALGTWVGQSIYVAAAEDEQRDATRRLLLAAEHESRREVPGVELETRILEGPTVPALLDQLGDAEMVVVGSRGLAGFTELLVGSTVVQLVSHAPCPVVVVRSLPYLTPGDEAGRVIVGVDGSPSSDETLAFAFEEASLRGQGLTAVHAWHVPFMEVPSRGDVYDVELAAGVEAESRSHVAGALAPWRDKYPDVDVRQLVVHGDPVQTIVEASTGAALTVVGSRGRGGFRNLLLGSVSHGVVHHARSAVAVVRPRS